jgi:hypothetical protein
MRVITKLLFCSNKKEPPLENRTGCCDYLSAMWVCQRGANAIRYLSHSLSVRQLRRSAASERRDLLCLLLICRQALSLETKGAGRNMNAKVKALREFATSSPAPLRSTPVGLQMEREVCHLPDLGGLRSVPEAQRSGRLGGGCTDAVRAG